MKQINCSKRVQSFGLLKKMTLLVLVAVLSFFVVTANQVFAADFDENDGLYYSDFTSFEETEEHALVVNEKIGEEGFILLKNDGVLPTVEIENVTVFGKNSTNMALGGGGSGQGNTTGAVGIYESLDAAGYNVNPVLKDFYENDNTPLRSVAGLGGGGAVIGETPMDHYGRQQFDSYPLFNDAAIIVITRSGSEGGDLPGVSLDPESAFYEKHYLELNQDELDMIAHVKANFENIIVVINNSSPLELGVLEEDAAINAVVWVGHPGTNAIMALGSILNGSVNPSGRTVDTYAADFTLDPTYQNFGDNSQNVDSGIRLYEDVDGTPTELNINRGSMALMYEEGIYVGYRYYETRGEIEGGSWYDDNVVYPFGYGLSYTTFSWSVASASPVSGSALTSDGMISVTVTVTNTGDVAGKDVVELYYDAPYINGEIEKSSTVLGGFAKTGLLQPGQSQDVVIELYVQDMASYDYNDANDNGHTGYELDAGSYDIQIKRNSHEVVATIPYSIVSGINYDNDRVTGDTVENRFTNDDYFNSLPDIDNDGTADLTMTIMSRADFAATFPVAPSVADLTIAADSTLADQLAHVFVLEDLEDETAPWYKDATDVAGYTQASQAEVDARVDGLVATQLSDMINVPKDDPAWDAFLNQLSYEELAVFVSRGSYSTSAVASIGKERATDADGPAGFGSGFYWASEVTIASSWNLEIAEQMGQMVGNEALWLGISGWYGPAMNTHRSSFAGRNFEYYSEDGFLGGKVAAATVRGAQAKGLYTYIKHFAINDQETERMGISTYLDEQAMREVYLKPFQLAVQEGGSYAVMSSFNRIGAVDASANYALLVEVLRNEWGFEGHVVTDYFVGGGSNSYMNLNEMWPMGNDIPLGNRNYSDNYAQWDETEGAPVYTPVGETEAVPSYSQWWAVRTAAKNVLYTSVNSNLMGNFLQLGTVDGALADATQFSSFSANVIPENVQGMGISASITSGSLPAGLSLNEATGQISGTPTVNGSFSFRVSYSGNYWVNVGSVDFSLEVASAFTLANLDALEENVAVTDGSITFGVTSYPVQTNWGTMTAPLSNLTYSVIGGALPAGLVLDAAGNITGTPTMPGSYDVTINVNASWVLWGGWMSGTIDVPTDVTLVVAAGIPLPTYDVTFAGNFTGASDEVVAVVQDTPIAALAAPYRPGAIFLGWFTDAAATTAVDFSANVAADVTYYAGWVDVVGLVEDLAALDSALDADVATINAAIDAVDAAITALQTTLEAAIAAGDDAVAADIATDIAALQASLDTLNSSLDDETGRIDDIETQLAETGCGSEITISSTIVFATMLLLTVAFAFVITRNKKQFNK